ncbi:MAG: beta-hydroxyacyl-ACP dehydratase [Gracilibacteraceae bacterium]|jgi:3-hydroxyacyl-[acyl-carrier-protein] dehydratase|nr:beta-hydroxyacyl-ACP dehydratase [Gracilibacteraceae bacterium]
MNKEELMTILPHRDAMMLIDEAEVRDGVAHGLCHIRGDEWFLRGHFPAYPVVPGVILCEMLAQTTGVLAADAATIARFAPKETSLDRLAADQLQSMALPDIQGLGILPLFTGLEKVRFRHRVTPGDTLRIESVIMKAKSPFFFAAGKGWVGEILCVTAEFSFALIRK